MDKFVVGVYVFALLAVCCAAGYFLADHPVLFSGFLCLLGTVWLVNVIELEAAKNREP